VSKPEVAVVKKSPRTPRPGADPITRKRVIDAAVTCILERGFYRASSNEIARQAGLTWGVIQYHFGTREALMLAVLEDRAERFVELIKGARIDAETINGRLDQLLDVLSSHYGTTDYLVHMQISLNLDHDQSTSVEVRRIMKAVADRSNKQIRRLLRETLGPAKDEPHLMSTLFLVLRGFGLSQQLLDTVTHSQTQSRAAKAAQRQLVGKMLTPYLGQISASLAPDSR
jgi:AcrR family transcriptional regulator